MQIEQCIPSYRRHLRAAAKSPHTIKSYLAALRAFGPERELSGVTAGDIEDFLSRLLETRSPATVSNRFRSLQQFFRWALREGEVSENPTLSLRSPRVPEKPVPVLAPSQEKSLLRTCEGYRFAERRDMAMIRLLLDTGMRRDELSGLRTADLDLDEMVCVVTGKGRKIRPCPFGAETAKALDRYLRAKVGYPVSTKMLFVGRNGPLTGAGVYQAVKRRARMAGLEVYPHQFRHTFAHRWLAKGGTEGDLMRLQGWSSRTMVDRYGASVQSDRAVAAYRRLQE